MSNQIVSLLRLDGVHTAHCTSPAHNVHTDTRRRRVTLKNDLALQTSVLTSYSNPSSKRGLQVLRVQVSRQYQPFLIECRHSKSHSTLHYKLRPHHYVTPQLIRSSPPQRTGPVQSHRLPIAAIPTAAETQPHQSTRRSPPPPSHWLPQPIR